MKRVIPLILLGIVVLAVSVTADGHPPGPPAQKEGPRPEDTSTGANGRPGTQLGPQPGQTGSGGQGTGQSGQRIDQYGQDGAKGPGGRMNVGRDQDMRKDDDNVMYTDRRPPPPCDQPHGQGSQGRPPPPGRPTMQRPSMETMRRSMLEYYGAMWDYYYYGDGYGDGYYDDGYYGDGQDTGGGSGNYDDRGMDPYGMGMGMDPYGMGMGMPPWGMGRAPWGMMQQPFYYNPWGNYGPPLSWGPPRRPNRRPPPPPRKPARRPCQPPRRPPPPMSVIDFCMVINATDGQVLYNRTCPRPQDQFCRSIQPNTTSCKDVVISACIPKNCSGEPQQEETQKCYNEVFEKRRREMEKPRGETGGKEYMGETGSGRSYGGETGGGEYMGETGSGRSYGGETGSGEYMGETGSGRSYGGETGGGEYMGETGGREYDREIQWAWATEDEISKMAIRCIPYLSISKK